MAAGIGGKRRNEGGRDDRRTFCRKRTSPSPVVVCSGTNRGRRANSSGGEQKEGNLRIKKRRHCVPSTTDAVVSTKIQGLRGGENDLTEGKTGIDEKGGWNLEIRKQLGVLELPQMSWLAPETESTSNVGTQRGIT